MTETEAVWVRTVVWPANWQRHYGTRPDRTHLCRCQYPCGWCTEPQHPACPLRNPHPDRLDGAIGFSRETVVYFPGGAWTHVWLADRVCRYLCDCPVCAHATGQPRPLPSGQQLNLFGAAA